MSRIIEAPGESGAPEGIYDDVDSLIARLKAAGSATEFNTALISTEYGIEEVEKETGLPRR